MDRDGADSRARETVGLSKPGRNTPAVKRKISAACSSCHDCSIRPFLPVECKTGSEVQQSRPGFRKQWGSGKGLRFADQDTIIRAVEDARRILGEYVEP